MPRTAARRSLLQLLAVVHLELACTRVSSPRSAPEPRAYPAGAAASPPARTLARAEAPRKPKPTTNIATPAPATHAPKTWSYDVVVAPNAAFLDVHAVFLTGTGRTFGVLDGGTPFVQSVRVTGANENPESLGDLVAERSGEWVMPSCQDGCRITYRFALRRAAEVLDDRAAAQLLGEAVQSPVSTWLLRPLEAPRGTRIRFRVRPAEGEIFATGVSKVPGLPDVYEATTANAMDLPYTIFGGAERTGDDAGGAAQHSIETIFAGASFDDPSQVLGWIRTSAEVVRQYYAGPPIPRTLLIVHGVAGESIGAGSTMGMSGASIQIEVGRKVTSSALRDDWILVHEMIHTALPELVPKHRWLEEGLATYVESVARAQAGLLKPEKVWKEWTQRMRLGLPKEGDGGLNNSESWGQTYWGGALFCLVADIEIRERTQNRASLRDALRGIVAAGGNVAVVWPIEKVLTIGDTATGVPVLKELYARMAVRRERVDLLDLWQKLGVRKVRGRIIFDDTAPLASIRRALLE